MKKKILAALIAALAAVSFTACGTSSTVNEAVSASNAEAITGMTASTVAGTYTLTEMPSIAKDTKLTFAESTVTLNEDGTYTLVSMAESGSFETTGSFTVADNGALLLDGGATSIVSKNEKITCNGETLVATGALGAQVKTSMIYQKND